MRSTRGMGGTFSFMQISDQGIDTDYIKSILDQTKERVEGPTFIE